MTFGGGKVSHFHGFSLNGFSESFPSDYDEDGEGKPFDIDDDLSADDGFYIYEHFLKK